MRIIDSHTHIMGEFDNAAVLKQMDAAGVDRTIVCSEQERVSILQTRAHLLRAKELIDTAPDRIGGLAWVDPTIPGMTELATEALCDMGYTGIKIIPDHWYPYEERLDSFWAKMHELKASILFHTGILYANDDGSRFCRPVYLEKLLHYPNIRFAMAHISWPWCEECIAVMGRMRAAARSGQPWQSYIDLTPGAPMYIRKQVISNAVSFCGAERVMFGTDCVVSRNLDGQAETIARELSIFDEIGLDAEQKARIMAGTCDELFPCRR